MGWLDQLGQDIRGSRPRCVLLMHGDKEVVADRLTTSVIRLPNEVVIAGDDLWMPRGKTSASEARRSQLVNLLKPAYGVKRTTEIEEQLKAWWNPKGGNTPNWDIASSCKIRGTPGLLLVEAKAHGCELKSQGKPKVTKKDSYDRRKNHLRIRQAIAEASKGLQSVTELYWKLSRDKHYQISNRFAWSWKLATFEIPIVLLYLGFLDAEDMAEDGPLFRSEREWEHILKDHSRSFVDEKCWGKRIDVHGVPLLPLIRAVEQPFQPCEG